MSTPQPTSSPRPAYRIGEAAAVVGVSEATLRYYERERLVVPGRTASNIRSYSQEDLDWIEFIIHMKSTGMSIADLREFVRLRRDGVGYEQGVLEILRRHREHVRKQCELYTANLEMLDTKIDLYEKQREGHSEDLFDIYRRQLPRSSAT